MSIRQTLVDKIHLILNFVRKRLGNERTVIPVVRLEGVIAPSDRTGSGLNLTRIDKLLDKAFDCSPAPCIALIINSPGGSPVQSRIIYERIRLLAEEKEKTVLGFCEDVAASGGYMLACSADEIFVDPASIISSIGVVNASFGFTVAMEKLGVERRLQTAGESKSLSDPFSPKTPAQEDRMTRLLQAIHTQFISLVKLARGEKLKTNETLFDGTVFTGEEAVDVGLADSIGEYRRVLQQRFGENVKIRILSPSKRNLVSLFANAFIDRIEQKIVWEIFDFNSSHLR